MDDSGKSNMISKKAARIIIVCVVVFVLAFYVVGSIFLFTQLRQTDASLQQEDVYASHDEPEPDVQDEPYEPYVPYDDENDPNETEYEPLEDEEPDIHPIIGIWRLESTTDHVNADMLEYGFMFYWHAYEDGNARSRMYSPHSGWHTIEEYAWSIPVEGQLEEVITYVNIQAFEMYLLGPEHAAMAAEFVGETMISGFEIDGDNLIQTMPSLTQVFHRVADSQEN